MRGEGKGEMTLGDTKNYSVNMGNPWSNVRERLLTPFFANMHWKTLRDTFTVEYAEF